MMFIIFLITFLIILDFAALRWGIDSTEGMQSCEWEKRMLWSYEHLHHE